MKRFSENAFLQVKKNRNKLNTVENKTISAAHFHKHIMENWGNTV